MSPQPDTAALVAAVHRLPGAPVLCVGDLMLDRFIHGRADRVSPEAPIPVMRVEDETLMPGGAGNVGRNLAALGARPVLAGVVGDDDSGRHLESLLTALAGELHLVRATDRVTTRKTRFVAGGQQLLRADRETPHALSPAESEALLAPLHPVLASVKVVVLSDYAKGVLTPAVCTALVAAARARGRPVLVDPKGRDWERYRGATLLTPNRRELEAYCGESAGDDAAVERLGRAVATALDLEGLLVTRSADGMTLVPAAGPAVHLRAAAREVFDVSGAGDTVIATLAAALASGTDRTPAAALANTAAGIVVGKTGTATVSATELEAALRHAEVAREEDRVADRDTAAERVSQWRRRGMSVGFTNGCFDLLHPGHLALLRFARAQCDRLVVGVNADASVARLKGPTRPVQSETHRALVLASLAMVDLVVIFEEDTPLALIETLGPDVLVKGADYTEAQVVGAEVVRRRGGRVALAPLLEGHSTTRTLDRLRG